MEMLTSKQRTALIIAGVVVVCIFICYMSTRINKYDYSAVNNIVVEETSDNENLESETEEKEEKIKIHITGGVKKEGVIELEKGERIIDAVEEAGGLTSEAILTGVNLAYELKDGQKIYIPKISDNIEEVETVTMENQSNVIIDNGQSDVGDMSSKVNINTATEAELQVLVGVGEGIAAKIIEHRQMVGRFNTIEEIKNVSGIGEAKYESIKDYICVD